MEVNIEEAKIMEFSETNQRGIKFILNMQHWNKLILVTLRM
jgi:hypothetical protein